MVHEPEGHRSLRIFRDGQLVDAAVGAGSGSRPRGRAAGCLLVAAVPFLLVTGLLLFAALASAVSKPTTTSVATVVEVGGPGPDRLGVQQPHCYVVAWSYDGRNHEHRTCEVVPAGRALVHDAQGTSVRESEHEAVLRFAAEHPVGSQVTVLHPVDAPGRVEGPIHDPAVSVSGGSPVMTAVLLALAALALSPVLLGGWLVLRRPR